MFNLLTNIAAQRSDVELIIHMGNLEGGLQAILDNQDNNIDAIISRGGTTELIRRACDIPVCDITPSVYDILRTIRLAQGMSERFAVVGFPSMAEPAAMLCEIMQFDCKVVTIHSEAECKTCLKALREEEIRVIVGDTISVDCCKDYGMHGLLIVSGIESVESAIDNAVEMHHYYASVFRRATLLSDVMSEGEAKMLICDSTGHEVFSNLLKISPSLRSFLQEQVSNVITQKSVKVTQRIGGEYYAVRGRKVTSMGEEYCVYTIQLQPVTAAADKYKIRYLAPGTDLPSHPLEYYLGSSPYALEVRNICDRYAAINDPFLLIGPHGTGKDRYAHYIYSRSKWKHSSFVLIDAGLLTEKGWDFLFSSERSPLIDSGMTIYFKNLNEMQPEQSQQLLQYLRSSNTVRSNRLIFSYNVSDSSALHSELYYYLTEDLHCMQLHTVPISTRPQDIPSLTGLYINALNVQFGTRVIGLTKDAMLTLQNQPWPRNVDQLVQFVQNLVIGSDSSYISDGEVRKLLAQEKTAKTSLESSVIDLNHGLDQITRDIVRKVYIMEEMNQTRTAHHLGISRSTVWRLLKE